MTDRKNYSLNKVGNGLFITDAGASSLTALDETTIAACFSGLDELRTYTWNGTNWSQVGSSLGFADIVGPTITALTSSRIAFIDRNFDDLRTYDWNGSNWSLVGNTLSIPVAGYNELAALDSNTIAIVTSNELVSYRFDGTDWVQVGNKLNISPITTETVSTLMGDRVVIYNKSTGSITSYRWNGTDWFEVGVTAKVSETEAIVNITAIDSETIVLIGRDAEELRVYNWDGANWIEAEGNLLIPGIGSPAITTLDRSTVVVIGNLERTLTTYSVKVAESPATLDHTALVDDRIVTQFKQSPKLIAYIKSLLSEANTLEAVFQQLLNDRWVDTAVGVNLDILGAIVGVSRTIDSHIPYYMEKVGNPLSLTLSTQSATALSPNRIALTPNSGELHTYDWDGENWFKVGNTFSLSTSRPAITTLTSNTIAMIDELTSELRTFEFDGTDWILVGTPLEITGSDDPTGITALDSSLVAILNPGIDELRTYFWNMNTGTWVQVGSGFPLVLDASEFPSMTTLDNNRIVLCEERTGTFRVFEWDRITSNWSQVGNSFLISNEIDSPKITSINSDSIVFADENLFTMEIYTFDGTDWFSSSEDLFIGDKSWLWLTTLNPERFVFTGGNEIQTYEVNKIESPLNDDIFRRVVKSQIIKNSSKCTRPELLEQITEFIPGTEFFLTERFTFPNFVQTGNPFTLNGTDDFEMAALSTTTVAVIDVEIGSLATYIFDGLLWSLMPGTIGITTSSTNTDITALDATTVAVVDELSDELRTYKWNGESWFKTGGGLVLPDLGQASISALSFSTLAVLNPTTDLLETFNWDGSNWTKTGSSLSLNTGFPSITALTSDTVAIGNANLGSFPNTISTYKWDGENWSLVGNRLSLSFDFNNPTISAMSETVIAVSYSGDNRLLRYRWDGENWFQMGEFADSPSSLVSKVEALTSTRIAYIEISSNKLRTFEIKLDDNPELVQVGDPEPIAAMGVPSISAVTSAIANYYDNNNEELRQYNFTGEDWSQVGNSLDLTGNSNSDLANAPGVTNRVAVASAGSGTLTAYSFDGTNFNQTGNATSITIGGTPSITGLSFSTGPVNFQIAFIDSTNKNLIRYFFDGTDWIQLGSALSVGGGVNTIAAFNDTDVALADPVANELRVYRWDNVLSEWSQLGNSFLIPNMAFTSITAVDSSTLVASISSTNTESDEIRIYNWDGNDFTQLGIGLPVKIDNNSISGVDKSNIFYADGFTSELKTYSIEDALFNFHDATYTVNSKGETLFPSIGPTLMDNLPMQGLSFLYDDTITIATNNNLETWQWDTRTWIKLGNSFSTTGEGNKAMARLGKNSVAVADSYDPGASNSATLTLYKWDGTDYTESTKGIVTNGSLTADVAVTELTPNTVAYFDDINEDLKTFLISEDTFKSIGNDLNIAGVGAGSLSTLNSNTVALLSEGLGELRTYKWDGIDWVQIGNSLSVPGTTGSSIATIGTDTIVLVESVSGAFRTFEWDGTDWTLVLFEPIFNMGTSSFVCDLTGASFAFFGNTNRKLTKYNIGTSPTQEDQILLGYLGVLAKPLGVLEVLNL